MKAIILEDEVHSAELLEHLLKKHCPELNVVGVYTDSKSGLLALKTQPPDLLFLDIEMPVLNGFDLLNMLAPLSFKVIFTTAYDKYAVRAFKYSAMDYLLKPIDISELKQAVEKVNRQASLSEEQLAFFNQYKTERQPLERLGISTVEGISFIEINSIIHCSAQGSYTDIFLSNGQKILISRHMKDTEEILIPAGFMRIHHSHLINLKCVKQYLRGEGGEVIMSNGNRLPVARSKKELFLKRIVKI